MSRIALCLLLSAFCPLPSVRSQPAALPHRVTAAVPLTFAEFFTPSSRELELSAKLLALNGKRVSLVGFMARQERAPKGAFYLCPCRTFCDEGAAGLGDLTPDAVRVTVRGAEGRQITFLPHPIQVSGILDVGYRSDGGQISWIRLTLDRESDFAGSRRRSSDVPGPGSPKGQRRRGR